MRFWALVFVVFVLAMVLGHCHAQPQTPHNIT
jgi:hypothetical protein